MDCGECKNYQAKQFHGDSDFVGTGGQNGVRALPVNRMECNAPVALRNAQLHGSGTNSVTVVSTEAQWFRWGCAEGLELMRLRRQGR
jgi:hypothetical protein